jgi:hypothetical protein
MDLTGGYHRNKQGLDLGIYVRIINLLDQQFEVIRLILCLAGC